MTTTPTSPIGGEQELSVEDQFFIFLALGRLLIECGIEPYPGYGLLEFDAGALLHAHVAGRLILHPELLREILRMAREQGYRPNRPVRRQIEARARELQNRSATILRAMDRQVPEREGLQ